MSQEPIFIGTEQDGVLRVMNDGRTFENASNGLPEKHITALDYLYERGHPVLLACTWTAALFYSDDNGASWKKNETGLLKNHQAIEYLQPHFSKIAVSDTGEIFLGGFCGIFKSSNKTGSWFKLETLYNYILGLGISPSTTIGYAVSVNTYGGGMYTTTDGGSSWEINNRGLINSRLGPIAYSPDFATDRTVFTGTYDNILKSTDGGQHWTSIPVIPSMMSFGGLKIIFRNRVRKLIFKYNLSRLGKLLSLFKIDIRELPRSTIGIAISPGFATNQTFFASISYGGLLRSLDGGFSFSQVWDDSKGNVSSLIISPVFPSDRTLFLSPKDGGIYRSCDGSETWQQVGADRDFGEMVLDISPNYSLDQTLFAGGDNGLFRSRDKGETWEKVRINTQEENEPVSAVAFSPFFATDRQFMVQIKRGDLFLCHDYGDRLEAVASTSGESGFEFSQLLGRDSTPLIKFSPAYNKDKTVYAASMSQLMKSTNSGISWSEIKRPCRYEAESSLLGWLVAPVFLQGQWSKENDKEYSSSSTVYSSNKNNQITLKFVGNGIKWLGTHGPDRGTASVFIDGEFQTKVDQYRKQKIFQAESFSVAGISYGCHTITISVDGLKNISSAGERIDIDAFDVSR